MCDMIRMAQQQRVAQSGTALRSSAALAESLNPYGVLARGYTIVKRGGMVHPVEELKPGQQITLQGARAEAACTVQRVQKIEIQGSHGQ